MLGKVDYASKQNIRTHASKLKLIGIKSDTAIAMPCPTIANHLRFMSVLDFIQLSFK